MSSNSQEQKQQKLQTPGGSSKAATLKQLKAAQQLKNLLKASASIDEQPDEEADANKQSDIEENAAKRTIPLLNKVKTACRDNYKQKPKPKQKTNQNQNQETRQQVNMSDSQEDSMSKTLQQLTLGANPINTRRYSGPTAHPRVAPNHQLNTRRSFENSQISSKQAKQSYELDNELQAEYRASLQPVYEPKHYLANCVPIQFIPLAASSGQQQQISGPVTRRRSPISCSCRPNSTTPASTAAVQVRRQMGPCSNFCCQLQQQLMASQTESTVGRPRSTSPYSTGNEQHQINKSPSESVSQSAASNDNNYDLQRQHQHQQQYNYHQYHQYSPHHHHRQHPCYKPRDVRRYSTCVASASCAINPNDTFMSHMALRRRDSTTTRLRRFSVFGQNQTAVVNNLTRHPTSTSCNYYNQVTQEIKVAPTQASSRIKSPSSRRHTLAIVSTW